MAYPPTPTLAIAACPPIQAYAGIFDPSTDGPLVTPYYTQGALLSADALNQHAAQGDAVARAGGGAWGVIPGDDGTGCDLSAGAGLTLDIAEGAVLIDGYRHLAATSVVLTASIARAWIWVNSSGAVTIVNNSLTPPAGSYVLLGSAVTGLSTITSVDFSGVLYDISGKFYRWNADSGLPSDTPPANVSFYQQQIGDGSLWMWSGSEWWVSSTGASVVLPVASGGTGGDTAPEARQNLGAHPYGVYNVSVATDVTLTSGALNDASFILFSDTGIGTDFTATFPNTGLQSGQIWGVRNNTGEGMEMKVSGGSESVYLETAQFATIAYDGAELREVGKPSFGYLNNVEQVVTDPTTYANWREVEANLTQLIPSGSPVNVNYPTAGALNVKGRIFAIRNDHATGILNVRTNGTSGDHSNNWFLPEEYQLFVIAADGAMHRLPTRAYTKITLPQFSSDANYTAVDPEPLGQILELTSSGSLTATRDFILPTVTDHSWKVKNRTTGGQAVRVKTASGAGVTIANGQIQDIYCNGTDILVGGPAADTGSSLLPVGLLFSQTATATVTNTTTETTLTAAGIGTLTLPVNVLRPGRTLRLVARGLFTDAVVPGTINVRFKLGSTTVISTGAQTPTGALTDLYWEASILLTCRTAGGSGTVFAQGAFTWLAAATGNLQGWELVETSATTIDTTATQLIDLTAQWGTADSGNSIRATNMAVELMG